MHDKPKNVAQKKRKGRRTRAEKVGRLKYIIQRIGHLEQKIDGIDLRTRTMMAGLREWMSFKPSYIQKVACQDEVDVEIIERLTQADDGGVLPSTIAKDLSSYGLRRWDVTRRIQRMNKKLRKELGKQMAEKRGHRWALSSFMRNAWSMIGHVTSRAAHARLECRRLSPQKGVSAFLILGGSAL